MSNLVFSRRALQQAINRLAVVLERNQLAGIVDRLNRVGDARLTAMWEIVMLDALTGVGTIRHEIELPNGSRPDVELTVRSADGLPFVVFCDVTSVSDDGLDELNPVHALAAELQRLATKAGFDANHFGYDVRGTHMGSYGDGRMKLALPAKGRLMTIMQKEVPPWIRRLKADPQRPDRFEYAEDEIDFSLTYDPEQRYFRGGYPSYSVAASRGSHPLFAALKRKKRDQLKHVPPDALRLIIVCDRGSALLRRSDLMHSPGTYSAREMAQDFLRQNSSIDAVFLVAIDEKRQMLGAKINYRMKFDLVVAPTHKRSARMTPSAIAQLDALLRSAVERMPQPVRSAYNVAAWRKNKGYGPDMIGGCKMSGGSVSVSSRALQRLLAGEISVDDFIAAHRWDAASGLRNPFAHAKHLGRMITKIEVEDAGDSDDDWVTFSFGSTDPATAPFRVPNTTAKVQPDESERG